ncbi:MAG TPA: hypothetical protein VIW21_00285 [Chthoniobacterales bacterium]
MNSEGFSVNFFEIALTEMSPITIIARVEKIHAAKADRRNFLAHTGG